MPSLKDVIELSALLNLKIVLYASSRDKGVDWHFTANNARSNLKHLLRFRFNGLLVQRIKQDSQTS